MLKLLYFGECCCMLYCCDKKVNIAPVFRIFKTSFCRIKFLELFLYKNSERRGLVSSRLESPVGMNLSYTLFFISNAFFQPQRFF